jgi:osmoprotectant transport system ATP-binding protein
MLHLEGVSKSYGSVAALRPTDLIAATSKITVLLGPSGCGKTTLLRLMIGLLRPDSGSVSFGGVLLRPDNLREIRLRIGYVVQDGGLFPHLTARENVELVARHLGWAAPRLEARTAELTQLVRLGSDTLARYPVELSGGQRQRVALMRALMLDPELLLLDEPLGALDPIIRSELQEDLRNVIRSVGKTCVMVTHDLAEAWYFGDTLVLLRDGTIVQQGSLEDMIQSPADPFVTKFINAQRSPLP